MTESSRGPDLSGRRVLVPGGTGTVGGGVVRRYLAAGADVVVPSRTQERADGFRRVLGKDAIEHLHVVVQDYTSFDGAEAMAAHMAADLGGIDDVVAAIGGWWSGRRLWEIEQADWLGAFVGLATAHMAVARACLPRMTTHGAYTVVLGESATRPVPGSGLVSMEQAAVLAMRRVLAAELHDEQRIFALVLGQVTTEGLEAGSRTGLSADDVGRVAVAASAATTRAGLEVPLHDQSEVEAALALMNTSTIAGSRANA